MKKILITQSNYIPWKGYFDSIRMVDEFIIYDDMQYTKRDWRNRNLVKTKEGLKWLSIPVEVKGKFFQKINETVVSEKDWAKNHWSVLVHNYSKAPCFKEVKDVLEELYLSSSETYLTKINHRFISGICGLLGIQTPVFFSDEFTLAEGKTERLVDLCVQRGATDYFTGPAAKNYMDENLFTKENIRVHYFDYSGYPEYPQLFPPFEHGVSILDLLFNAGKDAMKYMKNFETAHTGS
ncbi:MAG: WbqC family protein [Bacteroidetes bacterium]|nr:WbqC family protein [Bacteroidota bacterium]